MRHPASVADTATGELADIDSLIAEVLSEPLTNERQVRLRDLYRQRRRIERVRNRHLAAAVAWRHRDDLPRGGA